MSKKENPRLGVSNLNVFVILVAVLIVTVGYFLMGKGDYTLSPIVLIIAYVIIVPLGLLIKPRKKDN
jgi:membrane protein YdbS with pleckstrin-like domain